MNDLNQKFDPDSFLSPDVSYAPVYIWVWNDVCTRALIDEQLDEMQRLGIRAFYILAEPKAFRPDSMPTNLQPDYLSSAFFDLCAYAIGQGSARGMRCWLYDEGGWPSGGACGRVLRDHPEYARQVLTFCERPFFAGEIYRRSSPDVLAAFIRDEQLIEEPYRFASDAVVTEYSIRRQIGSASDYPDLLDPDATAYFIRLTHDRYAAALKGALGRAVTAVFTDEPKAPLCPFNRELAARYEAAYGESILPYLPWLAKRKAVTPAAAPVLTRWYDLCSRVFCEHFLLPCKQWANEHELIFTGHMDKDHEPLGCLRGGGNFHLMRALRCFDLPGVDVIWRQICPETKVTVRNEMNGCNGFFPRYASSAAAQTGGRLAMAEIFGVAGPGLTYDDMRFTVGYLAVRGVSVFNLFNFPLGRTGALLAQELPVFTEQQPYCADLAQFNRYLERLSFVSSWGDRVCDTALYYPIGDFQSGLRAEQTAQAFEALGRALEDRLVDFDVIDDDVIQAATGAQGGRLCVGHAAYRRVILPENATIPPETRQVLEQFVQGGGRVSYGLPDGLDPAVPVAGAGLRVMRRKSGNESLLILFREGGESGDYRVSLPDRHGYRLNIEDGRLQRLEPEDGVWPLTLAVGETAVILLTDEDLCAESPRRFCRSFELSGGFRLRKARELACGETGFEIKMHDEAARPVDLGDWSALFGAAYSGSGVYETSFSLPDDAIGANGQLTLGDVRFTAAVSLNGRLLGTVLAPPYRFPVPPGVLKTDNQLQIVVTNTSANWYVATDYFDKWSIKALSPYFEGELSYAKDSATGGLFGPVRLETE